MTENEAQSYCFALKKLTFDDQLPNRPKGASKLPSFHASLVVRTHLAVYRHGGSKSTSLSASLSPTKHMYSRSGLKARVSLLSQPGSTNLSQTKLSKPPQRASKLAVHTVLAVRTQAAKVTFFLQQTSSCRLLGALHVVIMTWSTATAWQAGTKQQCPLTQQGLPARPTGSWIAYA